MQAAFGSALNLTDAVITVRACTLDGDSHSVLKAFMQNGGPNYYGDYSNSLYETLNLMPCSGGFKDLTFTVNNAADAMFDPTAVVLFTLDLVSDGTGPWVSSTVYIDSVSVSGGTDSFGPFAFTSDVAALTPGTSVSGATFTWLNQ